MLAACSTDCTCRRVLDSTGRPVGRFGSRAPVLAWLSASSINVSSDTGSAARVERSSILVRMVRADSNRLRRMSAFAARKTTAWSAMPKGSAASRRRIAARRTSAFTTSGRFLWQRRFGSYVYSSPAVWDGRVFVGDYGGGFYALSASRGTTLWEVAAGGAVSGAAVVVDGVAYAGSFGHEIVGVEARSGHVLVRFPHGEYVPVSGSGRRLLLHGYSRVWAVVHR